MPTSSCWSGARRGVSGEAAMFPLGVRLLGSGLLAAGDLKRGCARGGGGGHSFPAGWAPVHRRAVFGEGAGDVWRHRAAQLRLYVTASPESNWATGAAREREAAAGWGGGDAAGGDEPAVYEFGGPGGRTYPLGYDPPTGTRAHPALPLANSSPPSIPCQIHFFLLLPLRCAAHRDGAVHPF